MKVLVLLSVALFFFSGCYSPSSSSDCSSKQVTCPAFDDNVSLQWAPYTQNQQLFFTSSAFDKDTFNISSVSLSNSYQQSVNASQPSCQATANFQTTVTSGSSVPKFTLSITLRKDQYSNANNGNVYVSIKGSSFSGSGFADTGVIKLSDLSISHFYTSATVGNKTFSDVQEMFIDTTRQLFKSPQIYKLWMAKKIGLIAYEEYHGKLWVKQ